MPKATQPLYVPNRGSSDWNSGTAREKELFLQFCEHNPHLICRSLADTWPRNLGGLLISKPGARWGYRGAEEKWSGGCVDDWPRPAIDHAEHCYDESKQRWVVVSLPNCQRGEQCWCIEEPRRILGEAYLPGWSELVQARRRKRDCCRSQQRRASPFRSSEYHRAGSPGVLVARLLTDRHAPWQRRE